MTNNKKTMEATDAALDRVEKDIANITKPANDTDDKLQSGIYTTNLRAYLEQRIKIIDTQMLDAAKAKAAITATLNNLGAGK